MRLSTCSVKTLHVDFSTLEHSVNSVLNVVLLHVYIDKKHRKRPEICNVMTAMIVMMNIIMMENKNSKDDCSNDAFSDIVDFDLYDVRCA